MKSLLALLLTASLAVAQTVSPAAKDGSNIITPGSWPFLQDGSDIATALGYTPADDADLAGKEPALGNPGTNGHVLSSTTGGTRSWIAAGGGGTWGSVTGELADQIDLSQRLSGSQEGLRNLKLSVIDNSTTAGICVMQLGDSFKLNDMGIGSTAPIRGSISTGAATAGGDSGVTYISYAYAFSPGGKYAEIAAGGNLTCAHLQTGIQGPADTIHYTLFPGTGSAQIQYSDNGGAWTNLGSAIDTTAITTVQVGNLTIPGTASFLNIRGRLTATGGTVNGFIGQSMTGPGIITCDFALAGMSADQAGTVTEARWKAMIAGYGVKLVVSSFADHRFTATSGPYTKGDLTYGPSGPLATLHGWSKAQTPTIDWLFVSPHRVDPTQDDGTDATIDAAFTALGISQKVDERIKDGVEQCRLLAKSKSEAFVDTYEMFDSYASATADGMYQDTIHLNGKGNAFKSSIVAKLSGISRVFGETTYSPGQHIGNMWLAGIPARAQASGLMVYNHLSYSGQMTPGNLHAATFRAGIPTKPEQDGIELYAVSSGVARLGRWSTSTTQPMVEFSDVSILPITDNTGQVGNVSKRFKKAYFNAINTALVTKTATYTVSGSDHTILCTSGTFTVTLPLAYAGDNDAYFNSGREIIILNAGAGTITIATTSDGANLQKIDEATTYTLGPAAAGTSTKVRLKSVGTLTAGNYANWITL